MIKDEITRDQVKKMTQEELFLWGEKFAKERQAEQIQKILIEYLDSVTENKVIV